MNFQISLSELYSAADLLADTQSGLSGSQLARYWNSYATKYNVRLPHVTTATAQNKRTALHDNLNAFPAHLQYALLQDLCRDRMFLGRDDIAELKRSLEASYSHLAQAPVAPSWIKTKPSAPTPSSHASSQPIAWKPPPRSEPTGTGTTPVTVFLSYSHSDRELVELVRKQLAVYERKGLIKKWWDREMLPGDVIDPAIEAQLNAAHVIVLFLSPDFLHSEYCNKEAEIALQRHHAGAAVAIPVILRPCPWPETSLRPLLALPEDGEPLTLARDRDAAALNIAEGIARLVRNKFGDPASGPSANSVPPARHLQSIVTKEPPKPFPLKRSGFTSEPPQPIDGR